MVTPSAHGSFSGDPATRWLTEASGNDRQMALLHRFSFKDPAGRCWTAEKGYVVDGASIPQALWSLVGSPYTGGYRRASIVHDKACDGANDVDRREADRMFYRACRAGLCSIREAAVLYIGVRLGSAWAKAASSPRSYSVPERPTYLQAAEDAHLVADFRLICQNVVERPELLDPDDPELLEKSVDKVMTSVLVFRGHLTLASSDHVV